MALFQKKPIVESSAPLYQLGLETTILIIGLGNIGRQYVGTKHNIGFDVLDHFAKKQEFPNWIEKKDLKAHVTQATLGSTRTIIAKPTTLMNNSGEAFQALSHYYKVDLTKTLIVHDELDIDFGQIRLRRGGSSAGNNGIKSIMEHGGEETARMRIGIGPKIPKQMDSADYVLAPFDAKQKKGFALLLQEANSILSEFAFASGDIQAETRSFLV